jgi:hypothetical protein
LPSQVLRGRENRLLLLAVRLRRAYGDLNQPGTARNPHGRQSATRHGWIRSILQIADRLKTTRDPEKT